MIDIIKALIIFKNDLKLNIYIYIDIINVLNSLINLLIFKNNLKFKKLIN